MDAQAFRAACRAYAREQVDRQRQDFRRLGVLGDWDRPYLTMDPGYEGDELRALAAILENHHLYKGLKPVHWCLDCGSALAEAEVEYEDRVSPSVYVRFPVVDEHEFLSRMQGLGPPGDGPLSVLIWTTTPWTLPANRAVAVNPVFDYVLAQVMVAGSPHRILVAEGMLNAVLERCGLRDGYLGVRGRAAGVDLAGLMLHHPFYGRTVPLVLGEHVTLEGGTGAVHTAPGHGQEDFIVGTMYKLPIDNPVDSHGVFVPGTELFAGEHVFKANDHIIRVLAEHNTLMHHESYRHSYPHCWRHKTPLIFRATPQWFIGMDRENLRNNALAAIQGVEWTPGWGESRIQGMVAHRPDWCISRQRTWGVPLALFVHKQTGALHPDSANLLEKVAQRVDRAGVDAWTDLDTEELLGDESAQYEKVTDILDVWFDSGVVHYCVGEKRLGITGHARADLYLEGSDQHRGWFQSSLLTSVAMRDQAPYKAVLTHGFVVDDQGRKMSKSLGNVISPQAVMDRLGADVLRLWVAATDYSGELSVSNQILEHMAEAYRKMRNTLRYLLANLYDFDPEVDCVPPEKMLSLDQWLLERGRQVQQEVRAAYDRFEFHLIYQKIYQFCVVELSSFYLDVIKDREYTTQAGSLARRSCQTGMYHVAEAMVRWLAPILSFTSDEIWHYLPGPHDASVFMARWHVFPTGLAADIPLWNVVLKVRESVKKELERLRVAGSIGSSLGAEVDLYCDPALVAMLARLGAELRFAMITSDARVHAENPRPADATAAEGVAGLWVVARPSRHLKCARCWHHREDVGVNRLHPELCGRCVENVAASGETRRFA